MKRVTIEDLQEKQIEGVSVMLPDRSAAYREGYFEWMPTSLTARFKTSEVSGGVISAWHHEPVFKEVEFHEDQEMFYFISGTAIMLFMDITPEGPVMESARLVRIKAGTQLVIHAGKGHFVAVAEGNEPVCAVVVAPKMDAPRVALPDVIAGV